MVTIDSTIWTERALVNSLVIRAQDGHRDIPQARPEMLADQEMALALGSYLQLIADGRQPLFVTLYQMPGGQALLLGDDISDINSAIWQAYDSEVVAAWRARKGQRLARDAQSRFASARSITDVRIDDLMDEAAKIVSTMDANPASDSIEAKAQQIYEWTQNPSALIGITSGISEIDRHTSGLRAQLHVIGARPGMGKTSLKAQCEWGQLEAGLHVYDAQLEDGPGDLANRIALMRLEMSKSDLRNSRDNMARYMQYMAEIRDHDGITWHAGEFTADAIMAGVIQANKRRRVDVVWIDHLGYLKHPDMHGVNLAYRIGQTTKRLQRLAIDLDIPVMLMVQLSRDGGDGQPPQLTDLRDSGEIEQDARHVWMLHRPAYYSDEHVAPHVAQQYQIWLRKTQDMPTGVINLMWRASCARIYPRSI